jgi:hypothetical protein
MSEPLRHTMPWPLWEKTFGRLIGGRIGTLRHESGQIFKVRVGGFDRIGDECHFTLEIVDEAAGNA